MPQTSPETLSHRLQQSFAKAKAEHRANFIAFLAAGDPDYTTCQELLLALPKAGVDIIELGMPFSDPMADGVAIQAGYNRALKAGHNMQKTFDLVASLRNHYPNLPIILMGYFNPILSFGIPKFLANCQTYGVDGLIVVDLPPEEDAELRLPAKTHKIDFIRLLTPTSKDSRAKKIFQNATGFVYYVSVLGITGSRQVNVAAVATAMKELKQLADLPIAVGFGITNQTDAKAIGQIADGVVVGSALVRVIESALPVELQNQSAFVINENLRKKILNAMITKINDIAKGLKF